MNEREDSPILGSCSLGRSIRLLRSSTLDTLGGYPIGSFTSGFVKIEGVSFGGTNPGGLDHFPGAGAPRGGTKEADGLNLGPRSGGREVCGFRLCELGPFWLSALAGGLCDSGFAHFEIGGAHFPRPAGVDEVSGDGEAAGLLLGIFHSLDRALTCKEQRVVYEITVLVGEWVCALTACLVAVAFVLTWICLERERALPPRCLCMALN